MKYEHILRIYPQILLIHFARGLAGTPQTDFFVNYVCRYMYNNATICEALQNSTLSEEENKLQKSVQQNVAEILAVKSLIDSIIPAFLSLFLGSWSDQNGRKPLLLAGYLGCSLSYLALIGMSFTKLNPWYLLLPFIPPAILGGFCTLMTATFCYVTDVTNNQERSWHLVCLEATMSVGTLVGLFTGSVIFGHLNYVQIFIISAVCSIAAFCYVFIMVPESLKKNERRSSASTWQEDAIESINSESDRKRSSYAILKSLFKVILIRRPNFDRGIVWCCVLILTINMLIIDGEFQVAYLFTKVRLDWTVNHFMTWLGVNVIAGIIGTLIGGRFLGQIFGTDNITVAIMANISPLCGAIAKAFTKSSWHMYLAICLGIFGDVTRPLIRTQISKSDLPENVGKLFSLNAFFETLIPFASGPLYTLVYTSTMPPMYPCPVWFVSVALYLVMGILAVVIKRRLPKSTYTEY